MKIGICKGHNDMDAAFRMGAEYIEIGASAVAGLEEDEFKALVKKVKENEIKTYSCNGLVPGDVRLTGDDVDRNKVRNYADKVFGRLAEVGVHMTVFGSSAAKRVPEGFPMEKAWDQLFEAGRIFSEYAGKYNSIVTVEALRRAEVNIVNTIEDAAYYVKNVNAENFLIMADFYHMYCNGEDLSVLEKYKDKLVHIHMAGPERFMPVAKDEAFLTERIALLKKIGYNGGISLECGLGSEEETKAVVEHMKELVK